MNTTIPSLTLLLAGAFMLVAVSNAFGHSVPLRLRPEHMQIVHAHLRRPLCAPIAIIRQAIAATDRRISSG